MSKIAKEGIGSNTHLGVTQPISLAEPNADDRAANNKLEDLLKSLDLYETSDEAHIRYYHNKHTLTKTNNTR